jgi:hypothetical protein
MSSSVANKTGFDLCVRGRLRGDEGDRKAHKAQGKKAFDRGISRISRRAGPEVRAAFEAGKISARRADALLYLEPQEQLAELTRLLSVREEAARRNRIAAAVIRKHVNAGNRDIVALRRDLQLALLSTTNLSHA